MTSPLDNGDAEPFAEDIADSGSARSEADAEEHTATNGKLKTQASSDAEERISATPAPA
jgi:hypothetical protein